MPVFSRSFGVKVARLGLAPGGLGRGFANGV
jgi:hypothetical protein